MTAKSIEAKGAGKLLIAGPDGIAEFDVGAKSSKPLIKPSQDNSFVLDPDVSPDGAMVAFVVQPPPKVTGKSYDAGSDVWVANRDGSGQRAVFTHNTPNQLVRFPQWENAGHLIAIVQEITTAGGNTSVTYTLERIDVATGQREHLLENVLAFGLSPDSKTVAYAKPAYFAAQKRQPTPIRSQPDAIAKGKVKHEILPVLIGLNYRITPTEIRVQVVETDRHLHRRHCRKKPCRIHEQHSRPPLCSLK